MLLRLLKRVFGTKNERFLKSLNPLLARVNELEQTYSTLTDDDLRAKIQGFREEVQKGRKLEEIEPDVYAIVREAAKRTLNMRHFDVQILGGATLHRGKIAEMKTGEGKTLVATLPACLDSLVGKPVFIVTVNDYLAKRDAEWMGEIYNFLGYRVGVVLNGQNQAEKIKAYRSDIVYGQNNEFAFDYLRDNLRYHGEPLQAEHYFAIIDEVDSILIDEARTPLIISGPAEDPSQKYMIINSIIPELQEGEHYQIDLKSKFPYLTEEGVRKIEEYLKIDNLYDPKNIDYLHITQNCLRAHKTLHKDQDYVVKNGKVIIVDEFTGRLMEGRRWSGGLHQAVEAKEGVPIQRENITLASISFQNYFRMFKKLAGMTGTADTEAEEFKKIYNLDVVVIPTHKPMIRQDLDDKIFPTKEEKYEAIVEDVLEAYQRGQPVLLGTTSIEQSEFLSRLLLKKGIAHNVLNAKHHEKEAEIIAQAGRFKAVTISTNMAGRGTDIILGGNPEFLAAKEVGTKNRNSPKFRAAYEKFKKICDQEREKVIQAGGLFVIGSERHESRRIDDQLRGRSGRQGDPGCSRFYISLEDDLLKRFIPEKLPNFAKKLKGESHAGQMVNWLTRTAQKKVENYHFEIRKHLLEYDNVFNNQRTVVYTIRNKILRKDQVSELLSDIILNLVSGAVEVDKAQLGSILDLISKLSPDLARTLEGDIGSLDPDFLEVEIKKLVESKIKLLQEALDQLKSELSKKNLPVEVQTDSREVIKITILEILDKYWNKQLQDLDKLREGIGFRGYGFKNPVYEFQQEAFKLFQHFIASTYAAMVLAFLKLEVISVEQIEEAVEQEIKRAAVVAKARV